MARVRTAAVLARGTATPRMVMVNRSGEVLADVPDGGTPHRSRSTAVAP